MPETLIGVRPIKDWVFVDIYDDGEKLINVKGGGKIWLPSDDKFNHHAMKRGHDHKHSGIRPRWAMVVGLNEKGEASGIKIGDKVFCDEMKWTRGFEPNPDTHHRAWAIKVEDILLVDEGGFTEEEREKLAEKYPGLM